MIGELQSGLEYIMMFICFISAILSLYNKDIIIMLWALSCLIWVCIAHSRL